MSALELGPAIMAMSRKSYSFLEARAIATHSAPFFIESTLDPHNPKHCGTCLTGAFVASTIQETSRELDKWNPKGPKSITDSSKRASTQRNPDLWNAVIKFLFVKRRDKQIDRLIGLLSVCSCPVTDDKIRAYHRGGKFQFGARREAGICIEEPEIYPFSGLSGETQVQKKYSERQCALIVELFCELGYVIHDCGATTFAQGSNRTWPFNPSNLMPYGPDRFMQAALQWYRIIPDPVIFRVTAIMLRLCQSLVTASAIKYNLASNMMDATKRTMDLIISDISTTPIIDPAMRFRIQRRFYFHSILIEAFLDECISGMPFDIGARILAGAQTKALEVCSIILYLADTPRMQPHPMTDDSQMMMAEVAQNLYHNFGSYMGGSRPRFLVHPKIEILYTLILRRADPRSDLPERAIRHIHIGRMENRCAARDCDNSLQSSGREFRRCSKCQVVSYCSPTCQKADWTEEGEFAHKKLCPVLTRLIKQGGGPDLFFSNAHLGHRIKPMGTMDSRDVKAILENWRDVGVVEEDVEMIVSWGISTKGAMTLMAAQHASIKIKWPRGYDDYQAVIAYLGSDGRGMERAFTFRSLC